MNPASGTDGFQLMKGTPFDLLVGILQEFFAVDAQMVSDLMSCSTIHPHHQLNGLLFTDMSLFVQSFDAFRPFRHSMAASCRVGVPP